MSLIEMNMYSQASEIIYGKKLSKEQKAEIKATYLEGLIRFLEIYAESEIGEGFEIDIMKVALFVNSPRFENEDMYAIHNVEDVYRLLEQLAILGLPIWRFLRLNDWQNQMLEQGYKQLLADLRTNSNAGPCYRCVFYREIETSLGVLRQCEKPETNWEERFQRNVAHDPDEIKECEWVTTLDTIPEKANELEDCSKLSYSSRSYKTNFFKGVEDARNRYRKELEKDPFRIPISLLEEEMVDLSQQYDPVTDLALAFGGKRGKSDRQNETRRAMYIEGMIRFFELYAKCEVGSNYVADIRNIALYIDEIPDYDLLKVKSFEEVYEDLEKKILTGIEVMRFIKYSEV